MSPRSRSLLSPLLAGALLVALPMSVSADPNGSPDPRPDVAAVEANRLEHLAEQGLSHASGNRPELGPHQRGNPETVVQELRIGLRYSYTPTGARSEFFSVDHPAVEIAGTSGDVEVVDQATGTTVLTAAVGEVVTVDHDGNAFIVTDAAGTATSVEGPVGSAASGTTTSSACRASPA